tara:strand:+ start:1211 stop:1678 length:468 start_codon:yes stop_codon:yes gene_type:complete
MTKFKVNDEVEILYTNNMGYKGDYRPGMIGKVIEVSGTSVRLHGDSTQAYEIWLEFEAVKFVAPQYPNPPLQHCEERIAHARGANIESSIANNGHWFFVADPEWQPHLKYRVKVEPVKTKDDLRIERLEIKIRNNERANADHRKEIAELKPTVHY